MIKVTKSKQKAEFGDFQTPVELAKDVCRLLFNEGFVLLLFSNQLVVWAIFLCGLFEVFSSIRRAVGVDINPDYTDAARAVVTRKGE